MIGIFRKKPLQFELPFRVDIHSHLLPSLDDGVKTFEESLVIIQGLKKLGYSKIITTPHILQEYYPNTPESINSKLTELKAILRSENIDMAIEAAAEYYLDETFLKRLEKKEPLLTIGDKYLLFETSFYNEPAFLKEAVFLMNSNGYKPLLAHPERYAYLNENPGLTEELLNMDVSFQANLLSFYGFYNPQTKKFVEQLCKKNMIRFVGTDLHASAQLDFILKKTDKRTLNTLVSIKHDHQILK